MAAPQPLRAPAGWDFHSRGHAAFAEVRRGEHSERLYCAYCRRLRDGDPDFIVAIKRGGEQHALFCLQGASPAQRAAMVHATDSSGSTALHWAAEFGFEALLSALLEAGAEVHVANLSGLRALEYAAKEGHVGCAEALAAAGAARSAPRARSALQHLAQAPWLLLSSAATSSPHGARHAAAQELVLAVRRLLQPHKEDNGRIYFNAGRPLTQRLAPLDATGATLAFRLHSEEGSDEEDEYADLGRGILRAEINRAADAAAVAFALAGALAAPQQPPLASLRVQGCRLPACGHRSAPIATNQSSYHASVLTCAALAALCGALSSPTSARHVSIELAPAAAPLRHGAQPAARLRMPVGAASALARALRAGWAQDGALRRLSLVLPRGARLCPQQRLLLCTRSLAAPRDAVTAVLLGACHARCGARSPLRLLSRELLQHILADCLFSVRIEEQE